MMKHFSTNAQRLAMFQKLVWATIAFNILQLIVGLFRNAYDDKSINAAASQTTYFSNLFFKNQCLMQQTNLTKTFSEAGDPIVVGINPMFFAESAVLGLVLVFVATVLYFTRQAVVDKRSALIGISIAILLFAIDQIRYSWTSIFDAGKRFFTWSSYCVQGDLAWLFDALGYVAEYGAIALCVAAFCAAYQKLTLDQLDIRAEHFGRREMFLAVEGTFSWLAYFGYAFLVIWVVFSGVTPQASKAYALQGFLIYLVIFGFYFAVVYRYARIAIWYNKEAENAPDTVAENPVVSFVAPHGTKAVQTFIKLALPIIFFLSVWFEWIKPLSALGGG